MTIAANYIELFEPYTGDGHTLESVVTYLKKTAATLGIDDALVAVAMEKVFLDIENGKEFPKDKCPCGCGIDKAATALIHEIRDYMISLNGEASRKYVEILMQMQDRAFNRYMKNKRTKKMQDWGHNFINPDNSIIWNGVKKIGIRLFRNSKHGVVPNPHANGNTKGGLRS